MTCVSLHAIAYRVLVHYACKPLSLSLYLYIYIYIYLSLSISLSLSIYIYIYLSLSLSLCMYIYIYIHVYLSLSLSLSLSFYVYIYIHTHIHTIPYARTRADTHTHTPDRRSSGRCASSRPSRPPQRGHIPPGDLTIISLTMFKLTNIFIKKESLEFYPSGKVFVEQENKQGFF